MRKAVILILVAVLANGVTLASIKRVGSGGHTSGLDYVTLQDAYDASTPGDTIYMYPGADMALSGTLYFKKRLVVVGPGYFLNPANLEYPGNSGLQLFNTTTTASGRFILETGADGSEFYGCNFETNSDVAVYLGLFGSVSNILFKRCRFKSIGDSRFYAISLYRAASNITFQQCVIEGGIAGPTDNISVTNLSISNCIFSEPLSRKYFFFNNPLSSVSGVIQNCIFATLDTQSDLGSGSWLIENCISRGGVLSGTTIAFNNNIGTNTQFPTGNSNQQNIDWTTIFNLDLKDSWDGKYVLKSGSPALTAGRGGIACGIFGGDPYHLSGIPPFPTIYALSGSAPVGNKITITLSTKTNN